MVARSILTCKLLVIFWPLLKPVLTSFRWSSHSILIVFFFLNFFRAVQVHRKIKKGQRFLIDLLSLLIHSLCHYQIPHQI